MCDYLLKQSFYSNEMIKALEFIDLVIFFPGLKHTAQNSPSLSAKLIPGAALQGCVSNRSNVLLTKTKRYAFVLAASAVPPPTSHRPAGKFRLMLRTKYTPHKAWLGGARSR